MITQNKVKRILLVGLAGIMLASCIAPTQLQGASKMQTNSSIFPLSLRLSRWLSLWRNVKLHLLGIALSLALTACQPTQPIAHDHAAATAATAVTTAQDTTTNASTSVPQLMIHGHDFSFDSPLEAGAGWLTIHFENDGTELHHAQLARLNEGVTFDQLRAALPNGDAAIFPLITLVGGVAAVDPGGSAAVTLNVSEGNYVWLCFIPSPADGVAHLAKGMVQPITVTAGDGAAMSAPQADLTIDLADFAYLHLPAVVKAGTQIWQIVNDGNEPHELAILKLAEGKSAEDVTRFFAAPAGPPPFTSIGGMQGLTKGESGYIDLNLAPGSYVAICNIPDPATGKTHAQLGMMMPFSVE